MSKIYLLFVVVFSSLLLLGCININKQNITAENNTNDTVTSNKSIKKTVEEKKEEQVVKQDNRTIEQQISKNEIKNETNETMAVNKSDKQQTKPLFLAIEESFWRTSNLFAIRLRTEGNYCFVDGLNSSSDVLKTIDSISLIEVDVALPAIPEEREYNQYLICVRKEDNATNNVSINFIHDTKPPFLQSKQVNLTVEKRKQGYEFYITVAFPEAKDFSDVTYSFYGSLDVEIVKPGPYGDIIQKELIGFGKDTRQPFMDFLIESDYEIRSYKVKVNPAYVKDKFNNAVEIPKENIYIKDIKADYIRVR